MKVFKNYILIAGLFIMAFTACEDNLDIPKHGNLGGMELFYQTDDDAMQALAAVYSSWRDTYSNLRFSKNALSDDVWAGGGMHGDNTDIEKLNEYTFSIEHGMISSLYSGMYSLIYNANLILDNIESNSDIKNRVIAEAKFFRAWAHFELVTLWGTAPAVDHVLSPSEYKQSPGTPENTWAFIEKDLTEAINSGKLPSKTSVNDQGTGVRITKETAQALLGKAYVFQGKWGEAATTLDLVINSGKYKLYDGDYGNILRKVANYCCESMLETNNRYDPNNLFFEMSSLMEGWRFDSFNVTGVDPIYSDIATDAGYGFFSPRKVLYDAFVAREGAEGVRLNKTIVTYDFLRDKIKIQMIAGKALTGNEGYFFWKNRILKSESVLSIPGFRIFQASNYRFMRYAEVLLLAAEAQLKNNNVSKATQYVNEIRQRAGLTPLGSITMDDIKTEKRLELCLEGIRYQDLVRWGDAPAVLGNQGKEVYDFNGSSAIIAVRNEKCGFQAGRNELLPIPSREMLVNPNMVQNVGW